MLLTGDTPQTFNTPPRPRRIEKDLSNTSAELEKLKKLKILAERNSLFDDKAVEMDELSYIIEQDVDSLNQQIAQLQAMVEAQGGQSGRDMQSHRNSVVVWLQSKVASVFDDFKSVPEVRTQERAPPGGDSPSAEWLENEFSIITE
ncbi:syntaxin-5-like [Podargus strigoides]